MTIFYVDTSAMVKRLVEEAESDAFERFLVDRLSAGDTFVSSNIMNVELRRFAFREGISPTDVAAVTRNVSQVAVSEEILETGSSIPHHITTLDAIHLGTAITLTDENEADDGVSRLVTYDTTMARVGQRLGYEIASPAD